MFPYSPKKGTPAAEREDQLLNSVKQERSKKLIALADEMAKEFMEKYIGETVEVLFEKATSEGVYEGHTGNYVKVIAKSDKNVVNQIVNVAVEKIDGENLIGVCRL